MYRIIVLITLLGLVINAGCSNNSDDALQTGENPNLDLTKLSTNNKVDQRTANEAKEIVSHFEEVAGVRAINHDKQILIAIEVDHFDRFNITDIEKELQKEMDTIFKNVDVTLSTDKKLFIELEKLENKLKNDAISSKDLKKKMNELKKLMKEQT